MALDFSKVKEIKIPNDNVTKITRKSDNLVLWQKGNKKYLVQKGVLVNGTTLSLSYDDDTYTEGTGDLALRIITNGGGGYPHTFNFVNADLLKVGNTLHFDYIKMVVPTAAQATTEIGLECIVEDDNGNSNAIADAGLLGDRRVVSGTGTIQVENVSYTIPTQFVRYSGSRTYTATKVTSLRQFLCQKRVTTTFKNIWVE